MQSTIAAIASSQNGLFTAADAERAGLTTKEFTRLVRTGHCRRLRRGLYLTTSGQPTHPDRQHALLTQGVLTAHAGRAAASHQSAAVLLDLPVWGCPFDVVHLVRLEGSHTGRSGDVIVHPPLPAGAIYDSGGPLVRPEVAALQIAMRYGVESGIVTMDAGMHNHRRGRGTAIDADKMRIWLDRLEGKRHHRWARTALDSADARSESVGESRLRFRLDLLGFVGLIPQVEFRSSRGFRDRVDLYDPVNGIIVEFDGELKYGGASGREALVREKQREDRLRALGHEIVRFVWRDLDDLGYLAAEMRRGIKRSRTALPAR
jgi:hypothetical protein